MYYGFKAGSLSYSMQSFFSLFPKLASPGLQPNSLPQRLKNCLQIMVPFLKLSQSVNSFLSLSLQFQTWVSAFSGAFIFSKQARCSGMVSLQRICARERIYLTLSCCERFQLGSNSRLRVRKTFSVYEMIQLVKSQQRELERLDSDSKDDSLWKNSTFSLAWYMQFSVLLFIFVNLNKNYRLKYLNPNTTAKKYRKVYECLATSSLSQGGEVLYWLWA